tara:strand:+ start:65 stop:469 length:405 start_codon:yes stop_codon:yes gene_type:complete
MEKYFYFRNAASAAEEDDEVTGSTYYPLSSFRGMCSGTSDETGTVTDDADAFSMFFTPKGMISTDADGASEIDVLVVAITTDNNQKAVMDAIMDKIVAAPHATPVITIFDKNKGGTAVKLHDDIEGITVIHAHQ